MSETEIYVGGINLYPKCVLNINIATYLSRYEQIFKELSECQLSIVKASMYISVSLLLCSTPQLQKLQTSNFKAGMAYLPFSGSLVKAQNFSWLFEALSLLSIVHYMKLHQIAVFSAYASQSRN